MNKLYLLSIPAIMLALCGNSGCEGGPVPVKAQQADKAQQAANQINFTENSEIDNIKHRLELTSKPSAIGFIMLINQAGQPILYASVKGKVTSGGKRLTPPEGTWCGLNGKYYPGGAYQAGNPCATAEFGPAPSDEGTWGSSSEYVYFWTASGQYYQWVGNYLYSDQPFRLKVEPLVIDVKATP